MNNKKIINNKGDHTMDVDTNQVSQRSRSPPWPIKKAPRSKERLKKHLNCIIAHIQ